MELDGPHHVTMITADARRNVDSTRTSWVYGSSRKPVNFDEPDTYHLYFRRRARLARLDPDVVRVSASRPGAPGAGMIHLLELGVRSGGLAGLLGGAPTLLPGARRRSRRAR